MICFVNISAIKLGFKERTEMTDKQRNIINIVFPIAILFRIPLLTCVAYILWAAFLAKSFSKEKTLTLRIIYLLLILFAFAVILITIKHILSTY